MKIKNALSFQDAIFTPQKWHFKEKKQLLNSPQWFFIPCDMQIRLAIITTHLPAWSHFAGASPYFIQIHRRNSNQLFLPFAVYIYIFPSLRGG